MNKVKYTITLLLSMLLFTSYKHKSPNLPIDVVISSKYVVLDEYHSPIHSQCNNSIPLFKEMNAYDCSFKVANMEFDIIEKYQINASGKMMEYWKYKSEGPLIYTQKDIVKDSSFAKSIQYKDFSVTINPNEHKIIDALDRCEIESIFPEEKLVLMKQNNSLQKEGRRILYLYK